MKISVNDKELFVISEIQKKVICNEMPTDLLDADLKRRIQYILMHKYERCFDRLKKEWEPILAANGVKSLPTDRDEFASLVFSQESYKDKSEKLSENK